MSAQALRGRRLELRALAEGDAAALLAAVEASRQSLGRRLRWPAVVKGAADCARFIADGAGRDKVYGVFERRSGELVGIASLQNLSETPGLGELSGWIRSDRRKKGYGLEAAKLLAAQGFAKAALRRLWTRIDPVNRPARKVLQRLGFRYEGCLRREKRLNGRWIDQECWGLLKAEWRKG